MNGQEREARRRASKTLRKEMATRKERGWENISASENLDVMLGREAKSPVEREAWELVANMRKRARSGGVTVKWLNDRLAERAGHWERSAGAPAGGELNAAERAVQERITNREPLTLDPQIEGALREIVKRIVTIVPAAEMTLGGGTILAARYKHRRSFDVDLWYPVLTAPKIYLKHGRDLWKKHLGDLLIEDDKQRIPLGCVGIAGGVEFSIAPATDMRNTAGSQPIARHEVSAQMTEQIMVGKISGRLCDPNAPVTVRDLYDIAIACRLEPEVMSNVLEQIRTDASRRSYIINRLSGTPDDLHARDPKPVVDARYRIEMKGLPRRLIRLFETGDPLEGPKATPQEVGWAPTITPGR